MVSKYIDNKELKRVIEDGKLKPFKIRQILKKQGIIITATNSEQIANQVYPILWGCNDIEKMSQAMDDSSNYIKSSVIEIEIEQTESMLDDLEELFCNTSLYSDVRHSLANIKRETEDELSIGLKYNIIRPGRIEFISSQFKNTEIIVTKISDKRALLDVRQASTSELKEIRKLLDKATKIEETLHIRHISLDALTTENKVAFFDEFIKRKFHTWRFETVTKVELKKSEGDEEETRKLDDEGEGASIANLSGITNAILSGTSIRSNSFVHECLQNGFYISTMGFKFENTEDFIAVVVEINLKYDDIKIDICKTYEYDCDAENMRLHPVIMSTQEEIIKLFQKEAYAQYEDILKRQKDSIIKK